MLFCGAADQIHSDVQVEPADANIQGGREHEEGAEARCCEDTEVLVEEGYIHAL